LVEVYVPLKVSSPDLVLETYFGYEAIQRGSSLLRNQILPIAVGALVLLQVVQVPLGVSLFRRVRRQDVEQTEVLARTLTASDRERRAIAADVHDGPVQDLAGVGYALSALRLAVPSLAQGTTDRLIGSVREAVAGLRTLMVDLYPPDLSASAMPAALGDLARWLSTPAFAVHLDATAVPQLSSWRAAVLYRTAKEALAVVPRPVAAHAWLSYGPVTMDGAPAALLRVSHDGPPASVHPTGTRVDDLEGLDLMRRELVHLGGSLTMADRGAPGAVVTAVVPVATPDSGGPPPPHRGLRSGVRMRETLLSRVRRKQPEPSRTAT
jgi:signal transduction histidine kinase